MNQKRNQNFEKTVLKQTTLSILFCPEPVHVPFGIKSQHIWKFPPTFIIHTEILFLHNIKLILSTSQWFLENTAFILKIEEQFLWNGTAGKPIQNYTLETCIKSVGR